MKATEQTIQQVERVIKKIAQKFPSTEEANVMTDIHLRVSQDSGEMVIYDDDDKEHIAELYLVDDDIAIIGGDLMEGLDKDLDDFFDELMK